VQPGPAVVAVTPPSQLRRVGDVRNHDAVAPDAALYGTVRYRYTQAIYIKHLSHGASIVRADKLHVIGRIVFKGAFFLRSSVRYLIHNVSAIFCVE
jgi:hypothetical protein